MFIVAHGAVTGGKSYDRSRCLSVPSERKAESKRRSLSIKDQAQEEGELIAVGVEAISREGKKGMPLVLPPSIQL